jgi:HEAT repeat protein
MRDLASEQEWVDYIKSDYGAPDSSLSDIELVQYIMLGLSTMPETMKRAGRRIGDILVDLIHSDTELEPLLSALADTQAPLRRQVATCTLGLLANRKYSELQSVAEAKLLELLGDDDWRVRFFATDLLGAMGNPEHMPVIVERLHDESYGVHCAAVRGLGRIGTRESAQELIQALGRENSSHGQIVDALAFMGPIAAEPILESIEVTHSSEVKLHLLTALSYIGEPRSFRVFRTAVYSEDWRHRAAAVKGLAALGYPNALRVLVGMTDDKMAHSAVVDGLISNVLWGRLSREDALNSISQHIISPLPYQQEAIEYLRTGKANFAHWKPLPQLYAAFVYQLDFDQIHVKEIDTVLGAPGSTLRDPELLVGAEGSSHLLWGESVRRDYHALRMSRMSTILGKHAVAALLHHLDTKNSTLANDLRNYLKSQYCRIQVPYDLFISLAEMVGNSDSTLDTEIASALRSHIEQL